jgi:hypothetical protein
MHVEFRHEKETDHGHRTGTERENHSGSGSQRRAGENPADR